MAPLFIEGASGLMEDIHERRKRHLTVESGFEVGGVLQTPARFRFEAQNAVSRICNQKYFPTKGIF